MRDVTIHFDPYQYFFGNENNYLSEEDKKKFNSCVITDVDRNFHENIASIHCVLFNDDGNNVERDVVGNCGEIYRQYRSDDTPDSINN